MSFKVTKTEPRGSAKAKKIASSISIVDATGSVTYTDTAGTVSHVDLSSTVEYTYVASAVSSRYISPSAITLGYYLLKHEAFDAMTIADVANFTYAKNLFDEIAVAGDKTIFYNMKAPTDAFVVTDTPSLGLQKDFVEEITTIDEYSYQVSFRRTFLEPVGVEELIEKQSGKATNDQVTTDDSIDTIGFGKNHSENPVITDTPSIGIEKPLVRDSFAVSDLGPTFDFSNHSFDEAVFTHELAFDVGFHLYDFANATDDFLGEANIDDDQTMHFGKTLIENFGVVDTFSRDVNYSRQFSDGFSGSDSVSLQPVKYFGHEAQLEDVFDRAVDYRRSFGEGASTEDAIVFATVNSLRDSGVIGELFNRAVNYYRDLLDSSVADDAVSLRPTKVFYDINSVADDFSRTLVYQREFSEVASSTDAIRLSTATNAQDIGTATESAVKSVNNINTDSASFTDSGLVFWQGYVEDPTYFAEDYVGNSQTF